MTYFPENDPADGLEFGRVPRLPLLIQSLIRDYPEGIGIIKEFLQNADDAGASLLHVLIDRRSHPAQRLPSPRMEKLQGPALLVYNDTVFSAADLDRIQEIAQSGKIHSAEKTGQFGKGFNSVYNVTDWPSFLTDNYVAFFDPHCSAVRGAIPEGPGQRWLLEVAWRRYPDLLEPFLAAGLQRNAPEFHGTIFRLPFRTAEHARASEISHREFTADRLDDLVRKMIEDRETLLLFLKHVRELRLSEITNETHGKPRDLLRIETRNAREVSCCRDELLSHLDGKPLEVARRLRGADATVISYVHQFDSQWHDPVTSSWREESSEYRVVHCLALDPAGKTIGLVDEMQQLDRKAVPLAGAATRLTTAGKKRRSSLPNQGGIYCSLPLPIETGLPVHLNGFFDLDSTRHSLTAASQGRTGVGRIGVLWNEVLVEHVLSRAYAELIRIASEDLGESNVSSYYRLWPDVGKELAKPLDRLAAHVFRQLESMPVIRVGGPRRWVPPARALVCPDGAEKLSAALRQESLPLADPPLRAFVKKGFAHAGVGLQELAASDVRDYLRVTDSIRVPLGEAPRPCLRRREWVVSLLQFVLSDDCDDLTGLPLALMADGRLRDFGSDPEEPVTLAGPVEREIFACRPEWYVDPEFADSTNLNARAYDGLELMTPDLVLRRLHSLLPLRGDLELDRSSVSKRIRNERWLKRVFDYLTAQAKRGVFFDDEDLLRLAIVPAVKGPWRCLGYRETPLLDDTSSPPLAQLVARLGVSLVKAGPELFASMEAFSKVPQFSHCVTRLSGPSLIDAIGGLAPDALALDEATCSSLLDYLSQELERAARPCYDEEQLETLRRLRLFATSSEDLVSLDKPAFLPSGFEPPATGHTVNLLKARGHADWEPILRLLGVKPLTRRDVIVEHLIPAFGAMSEEARLTALGWLRDNFGRAAVELEDDPDALDTFVGTVAGAELIRCTDGTLRAANVVYAPEAEDACQPLSEAVPIVDLDHYAGTDSRRRKLWHGFFTQLGMAGRPRASDLAWWISDTTLWLEFVDFEADEEDGAHLEDEGSLTRLRHLFHHVARRWDEIKGDIIELPCELPSSFEEFLKTTRWLPAVRDPVRLAEWPGAVPPAARLFSPGELWLPQRAQLVCAQHPVLGFETNGDGLERFARALGVRDDVPWGVVIGRFESLLKAWTASSGNHRPGDRMEAAFGEVYERLGSPPSDSAALQLKPTFGHLPCVLHGGRLWKPEDVFLCKVTHFGGHKVGIERGSPTVRNAFRYLGAKERPELEDYLPYLRREMALRCDVPLPEPERRRLLGLYRDIAGELKRRSNPRAVEPFPLLAADGRLRPVDQVFVVDDSRLRDRISPDRISFAHPDLPTAILRLPWVKSLSASVHERPEEPFVPDEDLQLRALSVRLSKTIQSRSFRHGLARLIHHEHGADLLDQLEGPLSAKVSFVREIRSDLVICIRGREEIVGSGTTPGFWHEEESCYYLCCTHRLAKVHLAGLINDNLGNHRLKDLSKLTEILGCAPKEIATTLDELRTRDFLRDDPLGPEDEAGEAATESHDGGGLEPSVPHVDHPAAQRQTVTAGRHSVPTVSTGPRDETQTAARRRDVNRCRDVRKAGHRADPRPRPAPPPTGAETGERVFSPADRGAKNTSVCDAGARMRPDRRRRRPGRPRDRAVTYVFGNLKPDGSVNPRPLTEEERYRDKRLGESAVDRVCDFEKRHGRVPVKLDHNHPGFDVESASLTVESTPPGDDAAARVIEVKGLKGAWGTLGVKLSRRQLQAAQEHADRFWLYVVEHADDPGLFVVHPIQNPFAKITEYRFDHGWRQLADIREAPSQQVLIKVGDILESEKHGTVTVVEVTQRGALNRLKVRQAHGDEHACTFNPKTMRIASRRAPE